MAISRYTEGEEELYTSFCKVNWWYQMRKSRETEKTVICNEGIKIVIKAINNRMGKFVQAERFKINAERRKERMEYACLVSQI